MAGVYSCPPIAGFVADELLDITSIASPRMSSCKPLHIGPTDDQLRLQIDWSDGHRSEYEPLLLRLSCPCAGCVEEMTGRALLDPKTVDPAVYPLEIEYVGRYALRFQWSDGHSTGIYPFDMLRRICPCDSCAPDH